MSEHDGAEWREASKREACPVCGKRDWCSLTGPKGDPDAAFCMREPSDRPKGDGWIHRLKDRGLDSVAARPRRPSSTAPSSRSAPKQPKADDGTVYATLEEAVATYTVRQGKPDHRWAYQNADGADVLVVLRWNAHGERRKEIRPVCRVSGGWSCSQPPKGRPLYRLADILTSDGVVYVTEGEPAADALIAQGLTATTSSGGSGAATKTDWSPLAGRDVVLLPDNDTAGGKYVDTVVERLGRLAKPPTVRLLSLPGLPEKGDAVDWFAAGRTLEELQRIVAAEAPLELPTAERPLVYRAFPTHKLPAAMARFVREAARAVPCDEAMIALPALAIAAGAIGATRTIRLKKTWYEPSVLWCVLVAPSGVTKSQGRKMILAPIVRRQERELSTYRSAMAEFGPLRAIYERDYAAWKKQNHSDELPPVPPDEPALRELLISDVTIEAVARVLNANPRGVIYECDELAAWFGSFGAYKGGKGGDAQAWMNLHGGGHIKVNRVTANGPPLFVRRACVSVSGTIQNGTFASVLSNEHRESGLAARLLIANPPRRPKRWTDDEVSDATEAAFTSAMLALLDLEFATTDDGDTVPVALRLTAAAQRRWVEFVNRHGAEGLDRNGDEAAAWSKLEGYAARLALVMTLFDDPTATHVEDATLEAAIELVDWFGHEAARFYRGGRESEEERQQRELAEWVGAHGGAATPAEVARSGPRVHRGKADEVEAVMVELVATGAGVWSTRPPGPRGGRPTRVFELAGVERKPNPPETADAEGLSFQSTPESGDAPTDDPGALVDPDARPDPDDGWEAA